MATIVRAPNRLKDPAVLQAMMEQLVPQLPRVRQDKFPLNATAMRHWNIWAARHDSAAYQGRQRAYITTGRRVIENWVAMLKRGAFPVSGKWFEVKPRTVLSEDRAPTVESLMKREINEYMEVRRKSAPIARGVVILGTYPLDMGWRVAGRMVPTVEEVAAEGGNGRSMSRLRDTVKRVVSYLGPTLRPIDFFRWYCWPTTVNDVRDLDLCFEDFLQDPRDLARLADQPIIPGREKELGFHIDPKQWAKAKDLLPRGDGSGDKFVEQRRRLAARGFQSPMTRKDDPAVIMDCERGYWRTELPGDDGPGWYEFLIAGDDVPLRLREVSTGLIPEPSYFVPKFVEVWEEFYGYGLPTAFDSSQYFLNDVFNQGGDALTWSLNPIAAVDPDAIQDHTVLNMKPGAKWLVRMPRQSIAWMEPPKESGIVALQAVQQLVALINDVGGVQPFAPGGKTQGKGRAVETLGGLQILASEGQLQIADVLQNWEDLWFNPMLRRMHDLNVQCLDEGILLNVEGVRGAALIQTNVTRSNLIGEFDFRWLATTYQYNQEVRTMQMNGFLQVVSRMPPEMLAQDNTRFRIGAFLRSFYEDGLMLPNGERFFQDAQPVRAIAPDLENELFLQGHGDEVKVSPADNDDEHLAAHMKLAMDETVDPAVQALVVQHMQQHIVSRMAKQEMMKMQQAMAMSGGQVPGGGGGGGGPLALASPGGGNGSDRLAQPDAPGRIAGTAGMADVARRMPRPGGAGPGGMI